MLKAKVNLKLHRISSGEGGKKVIGLKLKLLPEKLCTRKLRMFCVFWLYVNKNISDFRHGSQKSVF